jgi:hypothetical protein
MIAASSTGGYPLPHQLQPADHQQHSFVRVFMYSAGFNLEFETPAARKSRLPVAKPAPPGPAKAPAKTPKPATQPKDQQQRLGHDRYLVVALGRGW